MLNVDGILFVTDSVDTILNFVHFVRVDAVIASMSRPIAICGGRVVTTHAKGNTRRRDSRGGGGRCRQVDRSDCDGVARHRSGGAAREWNGNE